MSSDSTALRFYFCTFSQMVYNCYVHCTAKLIPVHTIPTCSFNECLIELLIKSDDKE